MSRKFLQIGSHYRSVKLEVGELTAWSAIDEAARTATDSVAIFKLGRRSQTVISSEKDEFEDEHDCAKRLRSAHIDKSSL